MAGSRVVLLMSQLGHLPREIGVHTHALIRVGSGIAKAILETARE